MSVVKNELIVDQKFTISIPSSVGKIKFVQNIIELIREDFDMEEELFSDVLVSTTEALVNAVLHGNRENLELPVLTSFMITEAYLEITVQDSGQGFDVQDKIKAFRKIDHNMVFGRGLFIIHELADKVAFSDEGRAITMIFNKKTYYEGI